MTEQSSTIDFGDWPGRIVFGRAPLRSSARCSNVSAEAAPW
jgi:hypothetical protein